MNTNTESTDQMQGKQAQSTHKLDNLIAQRWSPRAFEPTALTQEQIETILEAGTWAASGGNSQPWMFLYSLRGTPEFETMLGLLNPGNSMWATNAGALVLTIAKVKNNEGKPVRMGLHDTGSAMTTMLLQARSMDIYGHAMGGYDAARTRETYNLPEQWEPAVFVAFGMHGSLNTLNDELQSREVATRTRKPLSEVASTVSPFLTE